MSFAMNPGQIKRREYLGLSTLIIGTIQLLIGAVCLIASLAAGLLLIGLGSALAATGIFILTKIPDVLGQPEELW